MAGHKALDREAYLQGLLKTHGRLVDALGHAYYREDPAEVADAVADANRCINELASSVVTLHSSLSRSQRSGREWKPVIAIAYRLLERSLCLSALVNAKESAERGRHLSSTILDGYRILNLAFRGRTARWPDMMRHRSKPEHQLLGSVLEDNILILGELAAMVSGTGREAAMLAHQSWATHDKELREYFKRLGLEPTKNALSSLGRLMAKDEFRRALKMTDDRLDAAIAGRRVLELPGWDGTSVFPQFQVVHGRLPRHLSSLMRSVGDRISVWHLAFWLSQPLEAEGPPAMELLHDSEGLEKVESRLARYRVVGPPINVVTPTFPSEAKVRGFLEGAAVGGTASESSGTLFKVIGRRFGAFYYSQGKGRFDPRSSKTQTRGSCYFAESAEGAFDEILNRSPVVEVDRLVDRCCWSVTPAEDIAHIIDLTDEAVCEGVGYDSTISENIRKVTQQFAEIAIRAGANGIRYRLVERQGAAGIALFGGQGRTTPESEPGVPSFLQVREALIDMPAFWEWLERKVEDRHLVVLPVQTPPGGTGIQLTPRLITVG